MTNTETKLTPDINPETPTPQWEVVDLPAEVYNSYDSEEITSLLFGYLDQRGIDSNKVIYSGFDGSRVLKYGTFGDWSTISAATKTEILLAESTGLNQGHHSPVEYLEDYIENKGTTVPVIAVFDPFKLLGSDQEEPRERMSEVNDEDLTSEAGYQYWATKDGGSLDSATVMLFKFER